MYLVWEDALAQSNSGTQIAALSPLSAAILLQAGVLYRDRSRWLYNDEEPDDTTWDLIIAAVSEAEYELMSTMVGFIFPTILATMNPAFFLPCEGGTYDKDDYPLLYDAIDSAYIVSGSQFRVPDLRNRAIVGTGDNYNLDDSGGVDSVTLTSAQMPAHVHSYGQYTFGIDIESVGVPDPTGVGQPTIPTDTSSAGGGEAHENRMPFLALNYFIVAG